MRADWCQTMNKVSPLGETPRPFYMLSVFDEKTCKLLPALKTIIKIDDRILKTTIKIDDRIAQFWAAFFHLPDMVHKYGPQPEPLLDEITNLIGDLAVTPADPPSAKSGYDSVEYGLDSPAPFVGDASPLALASPVPPAKPPVRYTMFPIEDKAVWLMYKQAVASFWTAEVGRRGSAP